jgi:hypothetical protein
MGDDYRLHRLGAKPSERFPAVVSQVGEQQREDDAELGDNRGEPDDDDRDPVIG